MWCVTLLFFGFRCGVLFMFVTNNRTHETAQNLGGKYENVVDNVVGIATSTVDVSFF